MLVNATQIAQWARTKAAQSALPRLVRRLIHATGTPAHAAFPAGDSTNLPGWDGEVEADFDSAWVPKGRSCWEVSCEANAAGKASRDYEKRTKQTPKAVRAASTLVVVSARRWKGKGRWLTQKRRAAKWAAVRAYDADDLEQWLEQSPAVGLQFAEELGLCGPGVESIERYWQTWCRQSVPPITAEAFFAGREHTREQVEREVRRRLKSGAQEVLGVRGDSVEEAAAFACAEIQTHGDLCQAGLVVTDATGWRFVEQNPAIQVAVAARPELAERPVRRSGLVAIIPYGAGDMDSHYQGAAAREAGSDPVLQRPGVQEFEKALIAMGVDRAEAERLAGNTGRSWSVFRRRRAENPALRRPAWLDAPQAEVLSLLCLLGAWSASSKADREIVACLAGRRYEEVERDLRHLAKRDDTPVLEIGPVWKAKSSLELLDLFGERVTSDELDRFFQIAHHVLLAPDPELELPEQQRFAAQIYGKVRPQSGLLIRSICDTLIKLAVRGPHSASFSVIGIEQRIAFFVSELLQDADGVRWLSLATLLPPLAEAAPDAFIGAVDCSLSRPDAPVTRLFSETDDSGVLGRCWYVGLLWALEILAWAPARLMRVALVLARLAHVERKGNWLNSPQASLLNIFRSWLPQTAADCKQRIEVLDVLVQKESVVAFGLLDGLVYVDSDHSDPAVRPKWRDEDAGAGQGVSPVEQRAMLVAATDRLIACSTGHPDRIARLIEKIDIFGPPRVKAVLGLAEPYARSGVSDEDRERIREALRQYIYWHRNHSQASNATVARKLRPFERLYERLAPSDLVARHRWLFAVGWPNLPERVGDDAARLDRTVDAWRLKALREIHTESGMQGVEALGETCAGEPWTGAALAGLGLAPDALSEWIAARAEEWSDQRSLAATVQGLLFGLPPGESAKLVQAVLHRGRQAGWLPERMARLLVLARFSPVTREIAVSCGTAVEDAYWATVTPRWGSHDDRTELEFILRRLLQSRRPRSALMCCRVAAEHVDTLLLVEILERMLAGEEPDGRLPERWHLTKILKRIEASGAVDKGRLVRLEFGLVPFLGYGNQQQAEFLYGQIVSDPSLFNELLCIVYKPRHGDSQESPSETSKAIGKIACQVLHECRTVPGTLPDGSIDADALTTFVEQVREQSRRADRLTVCDLSLGQILAHAPADADGVWPLRAVRDVLDRPEMADVRRGLRTGVLNKRGMTWRAMDEGGSQERDLAATYSGYARAMQHTHMNLAATLEEIAQAFEAHGRRQDVDARLRREGY